MREPQAVLFHEGNDLVGLMPLVRSVGTWRTLRPMGIGPSDYLQPLARPAHEQKVAEALTDALASAKGVDLVDLQQVRETGWLAQTIQAAPITQATCLVLDLPETYEAYLASLGKSLRYDVRKLDKTMFTSGRAVVTSFAAGDAGKGLDLLFELHKKRWRKRHLPGAFLGTSVRFHREWVDLAARRGWLWLSALHVDDQPIGAIYAMSLGHTAYYYQAGFDPEKGAVSPGTLLVAHSIRRAIDEGKRHFDFMRGDEGYKRRWMPQRELRNFRFLLPGENARGRLGASWNELGSRVERHVRARLEGRGLI
jgi:CelD/BcsL family acetyltransferase involved in cellulose biosynthesis